MPSSNSAKTVSAPKPVFWILICVLPLSWLLIYPVAKRGIDCARYQNNHPYRKDIKLNFPGKPIDAELANTPWSRELGLGGRLCMHKNQAMLFEFDKEDKTDHCFWMKDMHFPLDILWLDKEKRVVFSASEVSPSTYPQQYCPARPASYVLEFAAGVAQDLGLGYDKVVPF